jgi:hypothetical protein
VSGRRAKKRRTNVETIFCQQGPGRGAWLRLVSQALAALALSLALSSSARADVELDFGSVPVGSSVEKQFTFTTPFPGPLVVNLYPEMGINSGDFQVVGDLPTVGGACDSQPRSASFTLRFTPKTLGRQYTRMTVTNGSSSTCGSASADVFLTGTGAASIHCPGDIVVSNDPGQCGANVTYPAPTAVGAAGAITCDPPSGSFFPVGTSTVNCASDSGATCSFAVAVTDGEKPVLTCPPSKIVAANPGQCTASLPTDLPMATDNCGTPTVAGSRSDGQPLTAPYPLGATTITWTATDAAGNQATGTQVVTVKDAQPPTISGFSATPNRLWPPNHQLVAVTVNYTASDNCAGALTWALSATSNEPDSGLDREDVPGDIQIVDAQHLKLRAERYGKRGRVYTLTLTGTDAAGNRTQQTLTVSVPH